ncbi:hypothetical protein [Dactylosporangium sp. NPDC050588]|uniref:hypothetical protein n=1 Tax=Dactylosporangium sp. NPDC050588 TaxID=3157211 RepID=UPI0033C09F24
MIDVALAVLILIVAGLPLGYALTRAVPLALVVAPIAGAAVATAAVLLMLAFTGPLVAWFIPVYALTFALAWRLRHRPRLPLSGWRDALLVSVPLVPPLLPLAAKPVGTDAHLIWWLHAGWFTHGGDYAREAISNPILGFTHPDYPPLASAPVALVWELLGIRTFYPAHLVTGFLTFSAIAMVVYAVRVATARGPALLSWPAAIAAGYAAWTPFWRSPTDGFSDAMCACAFAAAAVLILLARPAPGQLTLAVFLASTAALMKNEGVSLVAALALVATVKYRRELRRAAPLWIPLGVTAVWSVTARLLHAKTDVLAAGSFSALLHGDPAILGRLPDIYASFTDRIGWLAVLTIAAAVLGNVLLRQRRAELDLGADGWLWVIAALHTAGLVLIYTVTPYDLGWHLRTSIDRVTIVLAVLACASAACWAVTALTPLLTAIRPTSTVQPDPPVPALAPTNPRST